MSMERSRRGANLISLFSLRIPKSESCLLAMPNKKSANRPFHPPILCLWKMQTDTKKEVLFLMRRRKIRSYCHPHPVLCTTYFLFIVRTTHTHTAQSLYLPFNCGIKIIIPCLMHDKKSLLSLVRIFMPRHLSANEWASHCGGFFRCHSPINGVRRGFFEPNDDE